MFKHRYHLCLQLNKVLNFETLKMFNTYVFFVLNELKIALLIQHYMSIIYFDNKIVFLFCANGKRYTGLLLEQPHLNCKLRL